MHLSWQLRDRPHEPVYDSAGKALGLPGMEREPLSARMPGGIGEILGADRDSFWEAERD